MNYNRVQIAGNLTRDPEIRYTPSGAAVAKLGIATTRKWKDKNGATQEETTFFDVDAFGKTAEIIAQYLSKGRPIFIDGRLKLDQWDDKNTGQKRSRLGIVLEQFQFLNSAKGGQGESQQRQRPVSGAGNLDHDPDPVEDDEVPF